MHVGHDWLLKEERVKYNAADLRAYGSGKLRTIEPYQVLKELPQESTKLYEEIVSKWITREKKEIDEENAKLRAGAYSEQFAFADEMEDEATRTHFEKLTQRRLEFAERKHNVMMDLAELHLRRIEQAYTSAVDSDPFLLGSAPFGMACGRSAAHAQREAGCAFGIDGKGGHGFSAMDKNRTSFGRMTMWMDTHIRDDGQIDGKDIRHTQEYVLHVQEVWDESSR